MSSGATTGSLGGVIQYQGAELVPMGSVGDFKTVQELWAYCNTKLVTALDQVNNLDLEDDTTPEEIAKKVTLVKEGIDTMMKTTVWDEKYIDMPPSEFYRLFLGGLTAQHLGVKTLRKLYEHLNNASSQCKYAERYCGVVPTGWDTCYICGLKEDIDGLSPFECEHILPAFTSLGHYGLIESSLQLTEEDIAWYSYEYANSHQCCNQIKTDTKWIVFNPTTKQYEINEKNINKTLGDIYKGTAYDCPLLKPGFGISQPAFITNRKGYIIGNYLLKLVDMINRSSTTKGEAYNVLIRARQINALNITYDQIAAGLVGSRFTPPPVPIQELTYGETQGKEVQVVIETEFSSKIGPMFVESILGQLKILAPGDTLTVVQAFLETARLSSRQYENTIRNHAVDEGKLVGKELRKLRDTHVKMTMGAISLPITETLLKDAMVKGVTGIKQGLDAFVYNRIIELRPDLQAKLDTCDTRVKNMVGGGIAYTESMTPLDIEAGPVYMDKSILTLPGSLATITRYGRVSKPTLQLEYGLRGERYVSVRKSRNEQPVKYLVQTHTDGRIFAVDTARAPQFQLFENLGQMSAKDAAGVEYRIQMQKGGRRSRKVRRARRTRRS